MPQDAQKLPEQQARYLGQGIGNIDFLGKTKLQVRADGEDELGQLHRVAVREIDGLAGKLRPVLQDMLDKARHLLGIGIGVHHPSPGQHAGQGLVNNGKEQPMEPLDLVIMLAIDHGQPDNRVIQALIFHKVAQGQFRHELRLGVIG